MREWSLALAPAGDESTPVFLRIARAISDDVRRGRLRAGEALPGSRVLATSLGVHRNTVVAAYQELLAEGWLTSEVTRGTFVSAEIPDVKPRAFGSPRTAGVSEHAGFDLPPPSPPAHALPPKGLLSLNGGIPDVRLAPAAALARAYRRALRPSHRELLGYGDGQGLERLRTGLADMLSATRGVVATPGSILVTRGSQMAIDLIARTLLVPGDVVGVEALGYRPAWEAFREAGARLLPLPVDEGGIRVEAVAEHAPRLRALYLTPHHQYPTTVALAPGRRLELLALAARHRFAIIEDDYDHEFHYDGRPLLPLASADRTGVVLYVGTLSKVLMPGIRVGYLVAPAPVIARCTAKRLVVDRQGDHAVECAIAELLEDGEVQRHIRRTRRTYAERRDALMEQLARAFGGALSVEPPAGGTALWARVAPDVDVEAWLERALSAGVSFQPASHFTYDRRPRSCARFGFAQLTLPEMREAVARLSRAFRARPTRPRPR